MYVMRRIKDHRDLNMTVIALLSELLAADFLMRIYDSHTFREDLIGSHCN